MVAVYDADPGAYLPLIERVVPPNRLRVCQEPDRLVELAADAEVMLAFKFPARPFPRETVLGLNQLAWVQLASAGSDHMLPFDPGRLTVTNAAGIHGDTMAEYVIATLLHMTWDVPRLMRQQHHHQWSRYQVPLLAHLTMGIVGVGRVGEAIGQRARAFGMRVIGTRRSGRSVEGFDEIRDPTGLGSILAASDVVVITLPLTAETHGMFGAQELRSIKRGAWLINVSRGGIVDEKALVEVLREQHLAGAALDVFAVEPLPEDSLFWSLPNTMVTPHISSEFAGWPAAAARLFLENLDRYKRGVALRNVVDPIFGY